jgi:uncharacterized protein (TIGR02265 family)
MSAAVREALSNGHVKGSMLRAHLQWLRETHGEAAETRVLAALPEEIAREVRSALAPTWCPFETLIRVDREIASVTGREEGELMRELGRYSAQLNLSTIYRAFRRHDIHDFFLRSATLDRQFQDFSSTRYEQTGPTAATVRIVNASCYSPTYCASAIGYFEQVIALHGGEVAKVAETTCRCAGDEACTFELRWR